MIKSKSWPSLINNNDVCNKKEKKKKNTRLYKSSNSFDLTQHNLMFNKCLSIQNYTNVDLSCVDKSKHGKFLDESVNLSKNSDHSFNSSCQEKYSTHKPAAASNSSDIPLFDINKDLTKLSTFDLVKKLNMSLNQIHVEHFVDTKQIDKSLKMEEDEINRINSIIDMKTKLADVINLNAIINERIVHLTHQHDGLIVDLLDKKIKLETYFQLFDDIKLNLFKQHDSYDFFQSENNPFDPSRVPIYNNNLDNDDDVDDDDKNDECDKNKSINSNSKSSNSSCSSSSSNKSNCLKLVISSLEIEQVDEAEAMAIINNCSQDTLQSTNQKDDEDNEKLNESFKSICVTLNKRKHLSPLQLSSSNNIFKNKANDDVNNKTTNDDTTCPIKIRKIKSN